MDKENLIFLSRCDDMLESEIHKNKELAIQFCHRRQ